jgi:hypothetical protein
MASSDLQSLCEFGQQQLMLMDYLAAESTLVQAEQVALQLNDFETLSRLYMPLQEARRQRRQRCGEGTVHLRLLATGPEDAEIDPVRLIAQYPHGQLLIAGWGTIEPARQFRQLAAERRLYVETFLAVVYPSNNHGPLVAVVPLETAVMPPMKSYEPNELIAVLPPESIIGLEDRLTRPTLGNAETYAETMWLWEQLHLDFLKAADNQIDPLQKMDGYRKAIAVDYACELAHQKLSAIARDFARAALGEASI